MTPHTRIAITVVAVAALAVTPGFAQQSNRPQPGATGRQQLHGARGENGLQNQRPPRPPVDRALDANDDHQIDASEIAAASAALMRLDANGDGVLSAAECLPRPPRGGGAGGWDGTTGRVGRRGAGAGASAPGMASGAGQGRGRGNLPPPPVFTALDRNGDHMLDAGEIAAAPSSLRTLDRDGDGVLSGEECRPQRRQGPGGAAARHR